MNNGLVARTPEGLSDQEVWRRPSDAVPGGNPLAWLIGHVASTRASLLAELVGQMAYVRRLLGHSGVAG